MKFTLSSTDLIDLAWKLFDDNESLDLDNCAGSCFFTLDGERIPRQQILEFHMPDIEPK